MMQVEVYGPSELMEQVASRLDGMEGVSRVRRIDASRPGRQLVAATALPRTIDGLLDELIRLDVPTSDVSVTRTEEVAWRTRGLPESSLVWADVVGAAWSHARPIGRYLALMVVAGVIAGFGVIDENVILIVGAMAVSPDLLPIIAIAVGLVGGGRKLVGGALLTLAEGMAVTSLTAAAVGFAENQTGLLPHGFDLGDASATLGGLTSVNDETVAVALVAGVAGMLALETRAGSAVGVAVSVTTIPAAAYLGLAAGLGQAGTAAGALGLLGMNVAMMVLGASGTLLAQRLLRDGR